MYTHICYILINMYTSIYIWNPFVLWILNPSNRFVSLQKKGRVISFDFQVKRFLMIAYCPKLHIYIYIYSYITVLYTRIYIYTIYNHIQYIYICVCMYIFSSACLTNQRPFRFACWICRNTGENAKPFKCLCHIAGAAEPTREDFGANTKKVVFWQLVHC